MCGSEMFRVTADRCKHIELGGSEAALQAQLQAAESRHEGTGNGARKQTKVSVSAFSASFNLFESLPMGFIFWLSSSFATAWA